MEREGWKGEERLEVEREGGKLSGKVSSVEGRLEEWRKVGREKEDGKLSGKVGSGKGR